MLQLLRRLSACLCGNRFIVEVLATGLMVAVTSSGPHEQSLYANTGTGFAIFIGQNVLLKLLASATSILVAGVIIVCLYHMFYHTQISQVTFEKTKLPEGWSWQITAKTGATGNVQSTQTAAELAKDGARPIPAEQAKIVLNQVNARGAFRRSHSGGFALNLLNINPALALADNPAIIRKAEHLAGIASRRGSYAVPVPASFDEEPDPKAPIHGVTGNVSEYNHQLIAGHVYVTQIQVKGQGALVIFNFATQINGGKPTKQETAEDRQALLLHALKTIKDNDRLPFIRICRTQDDPQGRNATVSSDGMTYRDIMAQFKHSETVWPQAFGTGIAGGNRPWYVAQLSRAFPGTANHPTYVIPVDRIIDTSHSSNLLWR